MWSFRVAFTALFLFSYVSVAFTYVEALAGSVGSDLTPPTKAEPQVAVICDVKTPYHPQYMDSAGNWISDLQTKTSCLREKVEILEFCRKAYPHRNITNIVEGPKTIKIDNWCRIGHRKCKGSQLVKPYRCLEGAFQSEALLVPEQCVFDHVHNASRCWSYDQWNSTAASACTGRGLRLRSFAILLPCGVDLFSGVEFVCCPIRTTDSTTSIPIVKKSFNSGSVNDDDDSDEDDDDDSDEVVDDKKDKKDSFDDIDDDEYDDDDNDLDSDEDESTSTTTTTTTTTTTPKPSPTPDPYLTHYNPKKEREDFLSAEERLEERHRDRVSRIMKDWSDLEDRYQEMRSSDPKTAEEFKSKMTSRFQKLVKSEEDQDIAEKRQLQAVHQQRVLAANNEKKREAMTCYTEALNENPPSSRRIQKCLEKLLRALHKDRHHSIGHFRHLLNTNPSQAHREKEATIQHLNDIERLTNQSLQMLDRYPELQKKISPLMKDYLLALRSKDDTPLPLLLTAPPTAAADEAAESFKAEIAAKQAEKDRLRQAEKARKEDERRRDERIKAERKEKELNKLESDNHTVNTSTPPEAPSSVTTPKPRPFTDKQKYKEADIAKKEKPKEKKLREEMPPYVDVQAVQHVQEKAKIAHAQSHQVAHNEPMFSVRHEGGHRENRSVYFTLAFAGLALLAAMVVGVVLLKRRHARSPHQQGFIEVDQAVTPEERHVVNMQINGYENPTYKYFEAKD